MGAGLEAGGFALCFIIDCWSNFSGCLKDCFLFLLVLTALALTQSHCRQAPLVHWGSGFTRSGLSSCSCVEIRLECEQRWWKGLFWSPLSVNTDLLHLLPFLPNFLSPLAFFLPFSICLVLSYSFRYFNILSFLSPSLILNVALAFGITCERYTQNKV